MNISNTLEEEIAHKMSMQIQSEIDREVLWSMLEEIGWHRVMIDRTTDHNHAIDITAWLKEHVKNPYERNGRDFLFAAERDAVKFILKWV